MYSVYIIQSTKDLKYYTGVTQLHPLERLQIHNKGSVRSTKHRRPFTLVAFLTFETKKEAYSKEYFLKQPQGYKEKLQLISGTHPEGAPLG